MADNPASRLTVVEPGGGRAGLLGPGIGVVFKLWGRDTGGALAVVEHPFDVGAFVGPHVHTREDEYSIVLEGEIGFRSGDREAVLGPSGYIVKPRGELHAMWNAGDTPARMIEIISPSGFENFFRDVVDLVEARSPLEAFLPLADAYGLAFREADWMEDVIARFGLRRPPAQ